MGAAQAEGDLRQRRSGRDKDGHLERRFASQSPERPFRHQMKLKSSLFFITACFDMGEEFPLWARTPSDRGARTNESYALRCIVRIENGRLLWANPCRSGVMLGGRCPTQICRSRRSRFRVD